MPAQAVAERTESSETQGDYDSVEETREMNELELQYQENPNQIFERQITDIVINPAVNGRKKTAQAGDPSLKEMVASMERNIAMGQHPQQTPVECRLEDGVPNLCFGFRRVAALETVNQTLTKAKRYPVQFVIKDITEKEAFLRNLAENADREDLNPMDRCYDLKKLVEEHGMTQADAAAHLGISKSLASITIRFDLFPPRVQEGLATGKATFNWGMKAVEMLPKPSDLKNDTDGKMLKAAQAKILDAFNRAIEGGNVAGEIAIRKAEREASGKAEEKENGGKQATGARRVATVFEDIEPEIGPGNTKPVQVVFKALLKYLSGGELNAFIKSINAAAGVEDMPKSETVGERTARTAAAKKATKKKRK